MNTYGLLQRQMLPGLFGDPGLPSMAVPQPHPQPGIRMPQPPMPPQSVGPMTPNQPGRPRGIRAILGSIFGGQDDPNLTPEQNARAKRQAIMQAGLATLAAGPDSPGLSAIAQGAMVGQQAGGQARQGIAAQDARAKMQQLVANGVDLPALRQMFTQAIISGRTQEAVSISEVIKVMENADGGNAGLLEVKGADGQVHLVNRRTGADVRTIAGEQDTQSYDRGDAIVFHARNHPEQVIRVVPKQSANWQTQDTDNGPVQVNPTTGQTRPLTGADGAPLRRPVPRQMRAAISANRAQIGAIDHALEAVQGNPSAVGFFRGRWDAMDQRIDADGVDARARVADIGSMIIHDRSGAAVTVNEFPRLRPFVPSASDTPETVTQKLRILRQRLGEETNYLLDEAGGDPDAPAAAPRAPASGVVRDLSALQPPVRDAASRMLEDARSAGVHLNVVETQRSQARQDSLYQQGRTRPGPRVTWTTTSRHLPGRAIDFDTTNPAAVQWLHANAPKYGFAVPLPDRDPGHVEMAAHPPPPASVQSRATALRSQGKTEDQIVATLRQEGLIR